MDSMVMKLCYCIDRRWFWQTNCCHMFLLFLWLSALSYGSSSCQMYEAPIFCLWVQPSPITSLFMLELFLNCSLQLATSSIIQTSVALNVLARCLCKRYNRELQWSCLQQCRACSLHQADWPWMFASCWCSPKCFRRRVFKVPDGVNPLLQLIGPW